MPASESAIKRAADALHNGGLVIFPTETVYGIGAAADQVDAVRKLFDLKQRPPERAMTVHLGAAAEPDDWAVDISPAARRLMRTFWPGPLTVVLRSRSDIPEVLRGGGETIGLRVPDHPVALQLLDRCEHGVVATSANLHGQPSPTTVEQARNVLGHQVDAVLDGGECELGRDSTVVDLSTDPPVLLRAGALGVDDIESAIGIALDRRSRAVSPEPTRPVGREGGQR